jgi:hypothetical protein
VEGIRADLVPTLHCGQGLNAESFDWNKILGPSVCGDTLQTDYPSVPPAIMEAFKERPRAEFDPRRGWRERFDLFGFFNLEEAFSKAMATLAQEPLCSALLTAAGDRLPNKHFYEMFYGCRAYAYCLPAPQGQYYFWNVAPRAVGAGKDGGVSVAFYLGRTDQRAR